MDLTAISTQLSSSPALAVGLLFVAGVLTSLTPCVYPMIPITAAIVGGQSVGEARQSRGRTVLLTLSYVAGLAIVYAGLGVIAGVTGTLFGTISTNPWLYFTMANVLVLAALAMLDVIPFRLPAGLAQRAATAGTAGRVSGAFVMGSVSGLVAAPCGAPVMAAVLTWVTTTQRAALGFLYLLSFHSGCVHCSLLSASSAVHWRAFRARGHGWCG
ncbi:MAG: cytochrome c biogenesis protein CcdA [Gemmatimonadaceae bacterium]